MSSQIGPIDVQDVVARPGEYYRQQYVWQWPIRIYHWINALCVAVLLTTGLYIAWPLLSPAGEPWNNFVMGRVRQVHFAFAFVFTINVLWRIYWFWMGNNYARSGFPMVWKRDWWRDLGTQIMDYLRLKRGHVHLGHNALGGLAYTVGIITLGWAQILTGFAMYSESNPGGFFDSMAGWVIPLLGGSFQVHMWHHLFAWFFLVFSILHIYIVFYDGYAYKNGLVTSMVSGVKFYKEGDLDHPKWLS